jgi:glycosyltransferase involved in cell wall biosynthesis
VIRKLSIIIPCYNCINTLREAVDSCYTQGFNEDEFEIVMVDDSSTDETRKLIQQLSHEHSNIHIFFHNSNKGGGTTRNTAVSHTNNEVIFCLDSDDVLPPHTLDLMYQMLQSKKADGVGLHKSTKFIGTDINKIDHVDEFSYSGEIIPFESLLQNDGILCPLYSVFMFTKISFTKLGGYPTQHGFDTQGFAWRFLASGLTAYTCPNTNYMHRIQFHESYYLREQNQGNVNFNWQLILIEYLSVFSEEAQRLIINFDCSDFTKNLYVELKKLDQVFVVDYKKLLGTPKVKNSLFIPSKQSSPIKRNSLKGIFLRIRAKII